MNCLKIKRQARSGVAGVFEQPVQLRGAWLEEGGSQQLQGLVTPRLGTSSRPLPCHVLATRREQMEARY